VLLRAVYQLLFKVYLYCYLFLLIIKIAVRRARKIDFAALEVLITLAESDSFSEAAKRLRITQSAVSQALKQLEESTQCALVIRRSKPLQLTGSGLRLLDYAHKVFAQTNQALNELSNAKLGQISQINLGMIDSFADSLGVPVIAGIKKAVQRVSLRTGLNASLSDAFRSRNLDMLITADPILKGADFQRIPLIRDAFVVIAPAPFQRTKLDQLASRLPFIHYSPESTIGGQTDIIARRLNLKLNTQYEFDSTQAVIRFVQNQHGWAILSALCLVRFAPLLDDVAVINLDNGKHAREIFLLARKNEWGDLPSNIAEVSKDAFRQSLRKQLASIRAWLPKQTYVV